DYGAQRAANEALNFLGAAINLALADIARLSLMGRVRQHGIFARNPAPRHTLFFHPARHRLFHGHSANDPCVPALDQSRAAGKRRDAVLKANGPKLLGPAAIRANGAKRRGKRFSHLAIIAGSVSIVTSLPRCSTEGNDGARA